MGRVAVEMLRRPSRLLRFWELSRLPDGRPPDSRYSLIAARGGVGFLGVVGVREQADGEPGLHRVLRRPGVVRGEERAIVDHNRLVAVPADQSCEGEFAPDRCRRARLDRRQHSSRQSEHTEQREHRADPGQKVALHPGPSAPIDRCL